MDDTLRVLVIDDEKNIRATLVVCLESLGCTTSEAASADAALAALKRQPFDVVFLDLRLGTASGLDLLPKILELNPAASVVMVTAYATFDTAVQAIQKGARDYLPKPFTPPQIEHVLVRLRKERELQKKVLDLETRLGDSTPEIDFDTRSTRMQGILDMARKAAAAEASVLLRGENGTGKGVLARAIHDMSSRKNEPFVVVNCPSLPEDLLASELFGHVQGAFTGALRDRAGRVEAAEKGTLFLDEIGEISPQLQSKLLRFLQEKVFERVGESESRTADVRILAATNRDLDKAVKDGRFREDLLFRLNVVEIVLPPLRERPEDILPLARRLLSFFAKQSGRPTPTLSKASEDLLLGYPWPGNLRELRNAIERALILWPAQVLEPAAFPERIVGGSDKGPRLGGDFTVEDLEREHIERVIQRSANLEDAARILGIDSSTLWRKRKKYNQ
ncbi:MAG TPA: sigma-54 dependent transcriptional regulator [Planctomycetota bacterium]|nr:sigma-54 dependent transcriptional regulator [Planctomycetota bacterium]